MPSTTIELTSRNPASNLWYEIGEAYLMEDTEFTRRYETASWYTKILAPKGQRVKLLTNGYYVKATFDGTITDEHFVNRLFHASSVAPKRNIGKDDSHTVRFYDYEIKSLVNHAREDNGETPKRGPIAFHVYSFVNFN